MTHISRQTRVAASPDKVFALLSDLDRLPEWATIVVDTSEVSERPLASGCTFRQTVRIMGQELETTWRVTELEPGRTIAYAATSPLGGRLEMTQTVSPHEEGSNVELELDYDLPGGWLGDLVDAAFVEGKNEEEADRSLQNLKALLEARAER